MGSDLKPRPGDSVILTKIPPGLLEGLPDEDQRAISAVVGKRVRLNAYDEEGRAELQFTDRNGEIHLIYVSAELIRTAPRSTD